MHREPALPAGECDCGNSNLAVDRCHIPIASLVPVAGRLGWFIDNMGRECFIQPQEFPADTFPAFAAAPNLPDAHNGISSSANANGMNFDKAGETVVSQL
jgi:hypothetical protein